MRVEVLGCSGGIGRACRTTQDVLIDCGIGVGDLEREDSIRIDHVFLTHGHLDHFALLPMLANWRKASPGWGGQAIEL